MEASGTPPTDTPPVDTPVEAPTEPSLNEQLATLIQNQHTQAAEMAALRQQLDQQRPAGPVGPPPQAVSAEQAQEDRLNELADADYYCPGCGKTSKYPRECVGRGEAPHPAIEMVSTDEVKNRPDPRNDPDGHAQWQQGHTAAPAGEVAV